MSKRIGVVGSRPPALATSVPKELTDQKRADTLRWQETIHRISLDDCESWVRQLPKGTVLVSGGAAGIDTLVERLAGELGLETVVIRPDYEKHGPIQGPKLRNVEIVQSSDEVHAWPSPWSRGTWHSVTLAKQLGRYAEVHKPWERIAGGRRA